jgi:hypothetical protein
MTKKIRVKISGMTFDVPATCARTNSNGESYLQFDAKESASIVKQYAQQKYPQLKVWGTSDRYAGGSSARVYMCNPDASKVAKEIYDNVSNFGENFTAGKFDGMQDLYEYKGDRYTDDGIRITNYCSYVFVENKPKYGSIECVKNTLQDLLDGKYHWGVLDLNASIAKAKYFGATDKTISEALKMMSI